MKPPPIYVEILIDGTMDELWRLTQTPEEHQRWDLRFSEIRYLPRLSEADPQKFLYATRIGFGWRIEGAGESTGESHGSNGRVSALRFWSDDPKSLIRTGSGYWRYIPTDRGHRFLTRYDYHTRLGLAGQWIDRLFFRPLLGWATAWSFDRLRLWIERGVAPESSLDRFLIHVCVRLSLAGIWLYQGLVPKLLVQDSGELEILRGSRLFVGHESQVLTVVGLGEIAFGLLHLVYRRPGIFISDILFLLVLAGGAAINEPRVFVEPFNPVTLTVAMIALAVAGIATQRNLPTARRCRRRDPAETA